MKARPKWDTINSTYYWTIDLDPMNKKNNPNVPQLTGYSSMIGSLENSDKEHLLMRKVIMFVRNGYLDRSKLISVYKRAGAWIDKSNSNLVLELYPLDFCLHPFIQSQQFTIFLKKIYNEVLTGQRVDYLLPLPKQADKEVSIDNKLNVHNYTYVRKLSDLSLLCEKLIKQGIAQGQIEHFYRKFTEKLERINPKLYAR